MYCMRCGRDIGRPSFGICPYCGEGLPFTSPPPSGASVYIGSGNRWPNEPNRAGSFAFIASGSAGFASYYSGAQANLDNLRFVISDMSLLEPLKRNIELMKVEQEALARKTEEVVSAQADAVITIRSEANAILERGQLANKIVELMTNCNLLIERLIPNFRLFRSDIQVANELHTPCPDQDSFRIKVGAIGTIFEVNLAPIRATLPNADENWGSVKLLEEWFTNRRIEHWDEITEIWRKIIDLRNANFPYHPSDSRVVDLVRYFDGEFPIDFQSLWASTLRKFLDSLEKCQRILAIMR